MFQPPLAAKRQGEVIFVPFDFFDQMVFGETLSVHSLAVNVFSGLDNFPSDILEGIPTVSGSILTQKIRGGMAGATYLLTAGANGSSGNTYRVTQLLSVISTTGFARSSVPVLSGILPDGVVGAPYSANLTISGGYLPYEPVGLIPGAPAWMGFTVLGSILTCHGTPDESIATNYVFSPSIRDAALTLASSPQNIDISRVTISGDAPGGLVGGAYSYTYTFGSGTPPYSFAVISGSTPSGTTLNPATSQISGTLTTGQTASWVVQVTDANGVKATVADSAVISTQFVFVQSTNPIGFPYQLVNGSPATALLVGKAAGGLYTSPVASVPVFSLFPSSTAYVTVAYSPLLDIALMSNASELVSVGSNMAYSISGGALTPVVNTGIATKAGTAISWIPEFGSFFGISNYARYTTSSNGIDTVSANMTGGWSGLAPQHLLYIASLGKFVAWRSDNPNVQTTTISTATAIAGPWTVTPVNTNSYVWVEWAQALGLAVVASHSSATCYWTTDFVTYTPAVLNSNITSVPGFVSIYVPVWSPVYNLFIARIRATQSHRIAFSSDGKNWSLAPSSGIAIGVGAFFTLPVWNGSQYIYVDSTGVTLVGMLQ